MFIFENVKCFWCFFNLQYGFTALIQASARGRGEIVNHLLKNDHIEVNIQGNVGVL